LQFIKEYLDSFADMELTKQATTYLSHLLLEKSWPHDELLKASTCEYARKDLIKKCNQR